MKRVVLLVNACLLVGACASSTSPSGSEDVPSNGGGASGTAKALVQIDEPPGQPPLVTAGSGQPLALLSSEWYSPASGQLIRHYPSDYGVIADLPRFPRDSGDWVMVVDSSVRPQRFEAKFFASMTDGVPSDETQQTLCEQDCGSPLGEGNLKLDLNLPATTQLLVVMLHYPVPVEAGQQNASVPRVDYASYGAVIIP